MTTATKEKKLTKTEQRILKLKTALKELGAGKHKVAETLKAKKIKGVTGDAEGCPIAKFVRKLFPKAKEINVNNGSIEVYFNDEFDIDVTPPKAVASFIDDFDESNYPDLVDDDI